MPSPCYAWAQRGEKMKIAEAIFTTEKSLALLKVFFAMVFLTTLMSGCGSVAKNSESFYQNIPRRPINWREYLTD
jgi:hypothetical protein